MLGTWTIVRQLVAIMLAVAWIGSVTWGVGRAADYSWLLWLEHWTGDFRTALLSHRPKRQHAQLALVTITDDTMYPYTYRSPIDRRLLANLVTALDDAGARAVGLDFLFLKPTEAEKDAELVAAIRKAKARVVIAAADTRTGLRPGQLEYQTKFLSESGAHGGYANLMTGGDQIVRYVARPSGDPKLTQSFAAALAKPDARAPDSGPRRIAWMLQPRDRDERFFTIPAHLLITPSGKQTPVAVALLRQFKDKFVLVGATFPDQDRHQVPMFRWSGEEPETAGMMIQAQVAAQLLDGRSKEHLATGLLMAVLAVLAALGFWFGLRHGIVAVGLYASSASIMVVAVDMILFNFADRIIPFGACLAAMAGGLAGGAVLRLFRVALLPRA